MRLRIREEQSIKKPVARKWTVGYSLSEEDRPKTEIPTDWRFSITDYSFPEFLLRGLSGESSRELQNELRRLLRRRQAAKPEVLAS